MSDHTPSSETQGEKIPYAKGEVLRAHSYDGIEEYDNPPPMWLQLIFLGSVLFSLVYIPYYLWAYAHDTDVPATWLKEDMAQARVERDAYYAAHPELNVQATEESLAALVKDPAVVEAGHKQFITTCVACHGPEGQGLVGPNLTDNSWIHGGTLMEIRHTIDKGVVEKGMVPWGPSLKPEVINSLVAYIRSIQGSNPPNPKAPQGTVVEMAPIP